MSSHLWPPTSGSGDVVGPSGATNNAVARWDTTTGKLLQDSGVIIDDSDNVTGVNNLTIDGDLTVSGTTTTVSSTTMEVTDPNIIVNNGGDQATANTAASGFTVEMSDATDAVFGYDSTLTSKFKCGETGSLVEVMTVSGAQTVTNKTVDVSNNTYSNIADTNISASAAIQFSKMENLTTARALVSDVSGDVSVATTTATEIGYVNGVTSAIQNQIDGKEDTISLTASRAVVSGAGGALEAATTTSTEIGYVNGVTSAIQNQLNGKEATITGGATSITSSNLTASRALVSDVSGKVAVSDVTSTELSYLDGVTSAVQTQIDSLRAVAGNVAISSDVTLTDRRLHFVDTSAARSLALPAASATLYLVVKDSGGSASTNNITVTTPGAETVDGASTYVIDENYGSRTFVSDGTNYFVI